MSIYILRPSATLTARSLNLIGVDLQLSSRSSRVKEVQEQRSQDPVFQDIRRWINDKGARVVTATPNALASQSASPSAPAPVPLTGTMVLDVKDSDAEQLPRELPSVLAIRDHPMELIRPLRAPLPSPKASASDLTDEDLWHLHEIGLDTARQGGYRGSGKGVYVAILDTGVDESHPELIGRVAAAFAIDSAHEQVLAVSPSVDTHGHGTHVAGLIAGAKVGVAPEARIINGVVFPAGRANVSDMVLALEWVAASSQVQIVNLSGGIPGYVPELRSAVATLLEVGILPVFAIGNEARNNTRSPGNFSEPLSVGASTMEHRVASWSSSGIIVDEDHHHYRVPDLVAPGAAVYSCVRGGGYEAWDGTSMAAPIVSGVAALIIERYPKIRVTDLIEVLFDSCKALPADDHDRLGRGLVQVEYAADEVINERPERVARQGGPLPTGGVGTRAGA